MTSLIQVVEKHSGLAEGTLAALGLDSVQAIVATHEFTFVNDHAQALGSEETARSVYRYALAGQERLLRLYKASQNGYVISPSSQHYPYLDVQQPDSPSWLNQFPLSVPLAAPGDIANDNSPAAYLATLYWWASRIESIPAADRDKSVRLSSRRPDLATLQINDTSVNQIVPKIKLVKDTLSKFISKNVNDLAGRTNDAPTTVDMDTLLSRVNYPGPAVPYHGPYDQVVSSLAVREVTLSQVVLATCNALPAFTRATENATPQSLSALLYCTGLDPARLQLATTSPDTTNWVNTSEIVSSGSDSDSTGPDPLATTTFYQSNFGLQPPPQFSFSEPVQDLANVAILANQTTQSMEDILALFCNTGARVAELGSSTVTVTSNVTSATSFVASPVAYGSVILNIGNTKAITTASVKNPDGSYATEGMRLVQATGDEFPPPPSHDCYVRINQLYRLCQWTGLPADQLDNLLNAAIQASQGSASTINIDCMRVLGFYRRWAAEYGISAEDVAAILWQVSPYAVMEAIPQFDRIFNSIPGQQPILLDDSGTAFDYTASTSAALVQTLCGALGISEADFMQLAPQVQGQQLGKEPNNLNCSLPVLSALYRITRVASCLKLSISDLFCLLDRLPEGQALIKQLAQAHPALTSVASQTVTERKRDVLDQLDALAAFARFVRGQGLAPSKLAALIPPSSEGFAAPEPTTAHLTVVTNAVRLLPGTLFDWDSISSLALPATDKSTPPVTINWAEAVENSGIIGTEKNSDAGLICIESEATREQKMQSALATYKIDVADYQPLLDSFSATLQCQYGVTDGVLGEALVLESTTMRMMMQAFQVDANGSYDFLHSCLKWKASIKGDVNVATLKGTDGADLMKLFNQLTHQAMLVKHYALTPACLQALSNRSWFDLNTDTSAWWMLTPQSLYSLDAYSAWTLRTGNEDEVTQYLEDANATNVDATAVNKELARQLNIDYDEMQAWAKWVAPGTTGNGVVTTTTQVGRILTAMAVAQQAGLALKQMLALADLNPIQVPWTGTKDTDDELVSWQTAATGALATLNYTPETVYANA